MSRAIRRLVRIAGTVWLLWVVSRHSHWSVTVALAVLFVADEMTTLVLESLLAACTEIAKAVRR